MSKETTSESKGIMDSPEMEDYKEIWELAKPYLAKSRWWDLRHTEISVGFLSEILKQEGQEDLRDVLAPAVILHDTGWSTIGEEKNVSWGGEEMRRKHMEAGARIAEKVLEQVGYNPDLTKRVVHLVATHDNAYLGIEQKTIEEKLMRDADACFVLTDLSFWKDFHVKSVVKGGGMTPTEFLDRYVEKNSKRHTNTAQRITDEQIEEIKAKISDISITPLQRYQELKAEVDKINEEALK